MRGQSKQVIMGPFHEITQLPFVTGNKSYMAFLFI